MTAAPTGARAVLALRDFRIYCLQVLLTAIAQQAQVVAVGWDLYERTGSALALGWVGAVQFVPTLLLFLPAGQLADRHDRRRIMAASQVAYALGSLGLLTAALTGAPVGWMYVGLFLTSVAQTLNRPARDAMLPQIVPAPLLANAVALSSSIFQCAWIGGPALAGMIIALTEGANSVYAMNLGLSITALLLVFALQDRPPPADRPALSLRELFAGVVHVWRTRLVLGVLAVDLLTVMLAGANAIMPIVAKDVLDVGPAGLGWLSSAPAFGAVVMGLAQGTLRRPYKHAGRTFLLAVAGYGIAMMVFGLSTTFWLSLLALTLTGALDNLSVVLRHTVVQLYTPDELRGRVSAVNRVFVDSSNNLGSLRAGLLTAATSPAFTVVFGGAVVLIVVAAATKLFPEIRRLEKF